MNTKKDVRSVLFLFLTNIPFYKLIKIISIKKYGRQYLVYEKINDYF